MKGDRHRHTRDRAARKGKIIGESSLSSISKFHISEREFVEKEIFEITIRNRRGAEEIIYCQVEGGFFHFSRRGAVISTGGRFPPNEISRGRELKTRWMIG